MNTPAWLAAGAAALCLLAGCASPRAGGWGGEPAARGWIVASDTAAAEILRTCSRESPDRAGALPRWTPTRADITALERALPDLPTLAPGAGSAGYERQYVGFVRDGRRLVYVNAWPAKDAPVQDPSREAVRACDGGPQFWGGGLGPCQRPLFRTRGQRRLLTSRSGAGDAAADHREPVA